MNRKEFLSLSALGIFALSCKNLGMMNTKKTLGIQLYTVRNELKENVEKTLEKLAALGFNTLELYGYDGTFFGKSRSEFLQILKNTGMKAVSSHHVTGFASQGKGTLLNNWEKTIEDLKFLGCEFLVCSYLFPEERTREIYLKLPDLFGKCALQAQNSGLQFAYHNHDFEFENFENNQNFYDFLLQKTDPMLVKMELDLYWMAKAGKNPLKYFEKFPGRFPLWHVKDMEDESKDFTEIGNGIIPFKNIFEERKKAGLHYWFVEQDESKRNMHESLKISRDYIRQHPFFK